MLDLFQINAKNTNTLLKQNQQELMRFFGSVRSPGHGSQVSGPQAQAMTISFPRPPRLKFGFDVEELRTEVPIPNHCPTLFDYLRHDKFCMIASDSFKETCPCALFSQALLGPVERD